MKNNKQGFSLIELLAVVTIMGILMTVSIAAYSRYLAKSTQNAYDTLARSASSAAESYSMDHMNTTTVSYSTLVDEGYLDNATDPKDKNSTCTGKVNITSISSKGKLDSYEIKVSMCCTGYNYTYTYPAGTKVKDSTCKAS